MNLEIKFAIEREKRHLLKNPQQTMNLALNYKEDYLNLAEEMKNLEQRYQSVMVDNQKLTSQLIEMYEQLEVKKISVSLPPFLKCQRH